VLNLDEIEAQRLDLRQDAIWRRVVSVADNHRFRTFVAGTVALETQTAPRCRAAL
jgi:hypothetical protein